MPDNDLEMLIIDQVRLQKKVKRLLYNDDSDIAIVIDTLKQLSDSTKELTGELAGKPISSEISMHTINVEGYIKLVDASSSLQKSLEVSNVWSDLSQNYDKELLLISRVNEATIKRVHDSFMKQCKETMQPLPRNLLDFLEWSVYVLNLSRIDSQKLSLAEPEIGDFFDRQRMQSYDSVVSGRVKKVLLPEILNMRNAKALVEV